MNKIDILIKFLFSAKVGKTGKTKQGSIKYTPNDIYSLFQNNNILIKSILKERGYDTDYTEIFSLSELNNILINNTYNPCDNKDVTSCWFIKDSKGKFKLNKTPAEIIRITAAKIILEKGELKSKETRIEVKKRLLEEGKLRIADTYRTETQLKDPIDQIITNGFSSNYDNIVVHTNFNKVLQPGSKNKYTYTLTEQGRQMAQQAFDISNFTDLTINQVIEQEIQLSDKYDRLIELKAEIKKMISMNIISVCEIDSDHVTFDKENGDKYFVGHHVIPNAKSSISKELNTEVIGNYISMCPNCHDSVHYGSKEVKIDLISKILKIHRVKTYLSKTLNTNDEEVIKNTLLAYY